MYGHILGLYPLDAGHVFILKKIVSEIAEHSLGNTSIHSRETLALVEMIGSNKNIYLYWLLLAAFGEGLK